jgi:uncharacterized protein YjiS (DUF1127 family)
MGSPDASSSSSKWKGALAQYVSRRQLKVKELNRLLDELVSDLGENKLTPDDIFEIHQRVHSQGNIGSEIESQSQTDIHQVEDLAWAFESFRDLSPLLDDFAKTQHDDGVDSSCRNASKALLESFDCHSIEHTAKRSKH